MERNYIFINKSLIPYTFDIVLGSEKFTLRIDYNNTGRFFTVGLSKNGVTLCSGEPVIYGKRLFNDVWNPDFPPTDIVPFDMSGGYAAVTFDNLCDGVALLIDNGETPIRGV